MNTFIPGYLSALALSSLAGCSATNPPLMFGDTTTFGVRLGNDTATGGASVSLGYKAQSIAVVPVSVLDETGTPRLLKGHAQGQAENGDKVDAMSVFASFESAAPASGTPQESTVRLGQVFSTGLAAQSLTMGYVCRENADPGCTRTAATTALQSAASADAAAASATSAARAANSAAAKVASALADRPIRVVESAKREVESAVPASDRPYQSPLLFLRTDVVGIDIGGSLAQQGLQFSLGYNNRNLALIPVYAQGAGKKVVRITGRTEADDGEPSLDVLSVMGQFKTNTQTTRLGFGLDRYFATGVAARNLGQSVGAAIAKVPPADAPAPGGAVAAVRSGAAPVALAETVK
ncbi:hypothetical protein LJR290_005979 [Variovorax sp. LjRoot290]|uniref:hypothetical protein n=1 Tax=Variovorax sp. LjRoot290 TaxID=3342316 RepID=UPI003ECDB18F